LQVRQANRFTFNKDEMHEKPALPVRSPPVKKKSNSSPAPKISATSASVSHGKPGKAKTSEESPETKSPSVSFSEIQEILKSSILLQGITAGPTLSLTWAAQRAILIFFHLIILIFFHLRVTLVKILLMVQRDCRCRYMEGSQAASHLFF
jgi:hypothetical protein